MRSILGILLLSVGSGHTSTTSPASVSDLIKRLDYTDWKVRADAVDALADRGPDAAEAVPALIAGLNDWRLRRSASKALTRIGDPAIPALLQALDAENHRQTPVCKALARMGSAIVPDLLVAARHRNPKIRNGAISVLGDLGPAAERAIPVLIETLKRRRIEITFPYSGPVLVDHGIDLLNFRVEDDADGSRQAAASALARLGPRAVPALLEAAQSDYPDYPNPYLHGWPIMLYGLAQIDYRSLIADKKDK